MATPNRFLSFIKKLALLFLIIAVGIPLRYGSTDPNYLRIRVFHSLFSIKHSLVPDPDRPMLSADYRAFESLLRHRPVATIDLTQDPLELAKQVRASFSFGTIIPRPAGCQVHKQVFEYGGHAVDTHWIKNHDGKEDINADRIVLYFHGGAYIVGDLQAYSGFECHLSRLFNVTLLHVEYRLAPEHPLPAAVDDALALYQALLHHGVPSSRLVFMGDSAGGGLTLLTVQALLARNLPVPRAIITVSPWADFSSSGKSYTRNGLTDVMIRTESLMWGSQVVLGPNHAKIPREDPSYSPLFGSFKGFPPMYVTVGTAELLEDDSRQVVEKAKREGADVTLEAGEHLMHVHPIFFDYFPEARNTLDNIHQWLEKRFQ